MPELPEVESIVQALRSGRHCLPGRRIEAVQVVWQGTIQGVSASGFEQRLLKARFLSVGRHGKLLLFGLLAADGAEFFLVVHLRMTGRLYLVSASEAIHQHTRLVIQLDQGLALRFDDSRKFGRVWLVDDTETVLSGLGPDALTISPEEFAARLSSHQRQIKPLLLDQSLLAGIGNIYADEILFRARLHPLINSRDLCCSQIRRLHQVIVSVLEEAIAYKGANVDRVFKAGHFILKVYGREGTGCQTCGTSIVKLRVGQRGTHICPQCQHQNKQPRHA